MRLPAAFLMFALPLVAGPLWPGSRYSEADRDLAVRRGIQFIYSIAKTPRYFAENGEDLLWCLYTMTVVPADPQVRALTKPLARQTALEWRRLHPVLPAGATPDDLVFFATGAYAANHLGVRTPGLKEQMRKAAAKFSAQDFLLFDPRRGPPVDLPNHLRYDIWCDALLTAFAGDSYGLTFGAPFPEVVKWLPAMRPYPPPTTPAEFYPVFYSITHLIYTVNQYSVFSLDPDCFRPEFEFLKTNLPEAIALHDPETMGEFLDTLRSLGLTNHDPTMQKGVDFVLATQNADGSWGKPDEKDIYTRYHATWTAVDGLLEYRFRAAPRCR
jgi:hypothetical protein